MPMCMNANRRRAVRFLKSSHGDRKTKITVAKQERLFAMPTQRQREQVQAT